MHVCVCVYVCLTVSALWLAFGVRCVCVRVCVCLKVLMPRRVRHRCRRTNRTILIQYHTITSKRQPYISFLATRVLSLCYVHFCCCCCFCLAVCSNCIDFGLIQSSPVISPCTFLADHLAVCVCFHLINPVFASLFFGCFC